jgi:hypothetical protein
MRKEPNMTAFRHNQQQDLKLQIIDKHNPIRNLAEKYISDRYNSAFNAQLNSFMPAYMALMQGEQIKSLCGFRVAQDEPLFLEQYLNQDAQILLSNLYKQNITRANLIEFGQLASFSKGMSAQHFLLMAEILVEKGYQWCIFTATDPLLAMMARFGIHPTVITEADPSRIADASKVWGSYYQYQPRIVAGNLQQGLAHLRALFAHRKQKMMGAQ